MFVKTVHHQQQLRLQKPPQRRHQCQITARVMVKLVQGAYAIVMLDIKVTSVILKIVKISWPDQTVVLGKSSKLSFELTYINCVL